MKNPKTFPLKTLGLLTAFATLTPPVTLAVGDPIAGKRAAITCAACHGPAGVSNNPLWPNLAGQKPDYLAKQLKAFREDARKDLLMGPIAKNLTDTEMQDLAAYFASLPAAGL